MHFWASKLKNKLQIHLSGALRSRTIQACESNHQQSDQSNSFIPVCRADLLQGADLIFNKPPLSGAELLNQTLSESKQKLLSESRSAPSSTLHLPPSPTGCMSVYTTRTHIKKLPLCSRLVLDKVNTLLGHYAPSSCSAPQQDVSSRPETQPQSERWRSNTGQQYFTDLTYTLISRSTCLTGRSR